MIQFELDPQGRGKGTMSVATKIRAHGEVIELEDFASAPVMLTDVESRKRGW